MKEKFNEEDLKDYVELTDINDINQTSKPLSKPKENPQMELKVKSQSGKFIKIKVSHLFLIISLAAIIIICYMFIKSIFSRRTKLNLIKVKTNLDMSQTAGDIIINLIKKNPYANIGLSSKNTPKRVYKYLIDKYQDGEVSFAKASFFSLDEFCDVDYYSHQSHEFFIKDNFLNHIDANEKNIYLLRGNSSECQKQADNYNDLLNKNVIDLQILDIGADGHIGFNEPGTPFDSKTHIIKFNGKERDEIKSKFDYDLNKTPLYGVTQGVDNIMKAKSVLLVASGKEEAEGIKNLFKGKTNEQIPASALKNHLGTVYVVADKEACSLI